MSRANFRRAEKSDLTRVTKPGQVSENDIGAETEVAADVFKEDDPRPGLDDDPPDGWPEVTFVVDSAAPAGEREGLAGITRSDAIHRSAPSSASEGLGICPHRAVSHGALAHRLHQTSDCE